MSYIPNINLQPGTRQDSFEDCRKIGDYVVITQEIENDIYPANSPELYYSFYYFKRETLDNGIISVEIFRRCRNLSKVKINKNSILRGLILPKKIN